MVYGHLFTLGLPTFFYSAVYPGVESDTKAFTAT